MGISIQVAESDDDLEAWRRVRMAVLPNERCLSVAEMRAIGKGHGALVLDQRSGLGEPDAHGGDDSFLAPCSSG